METKIVVRETKSPPVPDADQTPFDSPIFQMPWIERARGWIERAGLWLEDRLAGNPSIAMDTGPSGSLSILALGRVSADRLGERVSETVQMDSGHSIRMSRNIKPAMEFERATESNFPPRASAAMVKRTPNPAAGIPSSQTMAGRRVSMEDPNTFIQNGMEVFTAFSRQNYWQQATISSRFNVDNFSRVDIAELAELLTELSPEVSAALWYYIVCCNSGYEITVTKPGTSEVYQEADDYLKAALKMLGGYHGTLNTFFDKLFMNIFLRGSILMEAVLGDNGRRFIDIAIPDTRTLSYRKVLDEERGVVWQVGQWQLGKWVSFYDIPTIRYIPLHPLPGRIEGRPMISAAFFVSIFLMAVLRDLKRVVQQQGYLRFDVEVMFEKLKEAMPDGADSDPEIFKQWADQVIADVERFYGSLEPDDAFVHSDAVKINTPVGTANMNSLGAMDALFKMLERMAVRALKTIPALLGLDESGDQGSNNRKFEFYQKGNETIQRMVETGCDDIFSLILQGGGYLADVKTAFAQMRASEELRDLQIASLKAKLSRYYYDCGWYSQSEAAKMATGKAEADQEAPRTLDPAATDSLNTGSLEQLQPDPGVNRFEAISKLFHGQDVHDMLRLPTLGELQNAEALFKEYAPEGFRDLLNAKTYAPESETE